MKKILFCMLLFQMSTLLCHRCGLNEHQKMLYDAIVKDSVLGVERAIGMGKVTIDEHIYEKPAILMALLLNKPQTVDFLLRSGATVKQDYIEVALREKNIKVAYLIAKRCGASLETRYCNRLLLDHALVLQEHDLAIEIARLVSVNCPHIADGFANNLFFYVYPNSNIDVLLEAYQIIINRGYPIDKFLDSNFLFSPFSTTNDPKSGAIEKIIKFFKKNGADLNFMRNSGEVCSTFLVRSMHSLNAVKLLIEFNVDINKKGKYNGMTLQTPLAYAIESGVSKDIIKLLLESGAVL